MNVNDIVKRLNRMSNNQDVPHRHRRDISETMRLIQNMQEQIDALRIKADQFDATEALFESMPQLQQMLRQEMENAK